MRSTKIDINVLANIVAQTSVTVDAFVTIFCKEKLEKTMVDICVLRFPDIDNPYFKVSLLHCIRLIWLRCIRGEQVYRIKVVAWSQSKRVLMVQDEQSGLTGGQYTFCAV